MKKITLALLGSIGFFGTMKSQFVIEAPVDNGSTSSFRAPNGTSQHMYQRTVMYISPAELLPMTLSTINSFSFQYTNGTGAAAPTAGNFTVYMQNTNDNDYLKGTNWTTAIAPMSLVYNGTYNVPNTAGASTVGVALTTPFNYTGGGLYVAYDWFCPGPYATNTATYASNNIKTQCATADASVAPVGTTLGFSNFRPSLIFNATNTATNDVNVLDVLTDGHISKLLGQGQVIVSNISNGGINAVNNLSIALTVGGANTFTNVKVIPTLAAGAITSVTFDPFPSTNGGVNTCSVTALVVDQLLTNNQRVWTQSVTCSDVGALPPVTGAQFMTTNAYGMSSGTGFIYSMFYNPPVNTTLTAVKMVVANFPANNVGKPITPVLLDATGNILYTGNPVNTTASMMGAWTTFNLPVPQALTANTDYFFGVSINSPTFFPMAILENTYTPYFFSPGYFQSPAAGGSIAQVDVDYLGLLGVLSFTNTQITASATRTSVCKGSPVTVTLTATGADTYTWSAAGLGNGGTAAYTPTAAGNGTLTQVTVVGNYTQGIAQGCRTNTASLLFSLAACTGIADNSGDLAVKVMPNPAVAGKTTISNLSGVNTIMVFNALGQIVINRTVSTEAESIDLSNFPSGNYLVRITDSNNETRVVKLVNQN